MNRGDLFKVERFLGLPAAAVTMPQAVDIVERVLKNRSGPFFVASVNPEICVAARKNKELFDAVASCGMGIPDGVGIVLASRLTGGGIRSRVTGIDLMSDLVRMAAERGTAIFLFGAAPGVAQEAADKLIAIYPELKVAGIRHGYVDLQQEAEVADDIRNTGANMVFVGLGSPRQELFIQHHGAATGADVLMAVGGSFDVFSGRIMRAPRFFRMFGVEWLYRAFLQPERAMRLLKLPVFIAMALYEGMRRKG